MPTKMKNKEIGIYIDRTYKVVRQDLITRFKVASIDLTPEQWVILSKLQADGQMSQSDLASSSFKDKPTVSRILDLLVTKGYVERCPDGSDRRKFKIKITQQGIAEIAKATPVVDDSRVQGWKGLTEEEHQQLIILLDKIFENYTEPDR
jgi:DNA-binding MarR family transcriptional regulator